MDERRASSDRLIPWVVLGAFLALTAVASAYVWRMSRVADLVRFENAVQATHDGIVFRLETYVNVLRSASGLFAMNRSATSEDLRQFLRHLNVQKRYPGIQGIGLSIRIDAAELKGVESQMREDGLPNFRVWPAYQRPEYHAIVLLEPFDRRNRAAIGFDMFASPPRREAMIRARDTGIPSATRPVTLVQEIDEEKQSGFLIYVPIYGSRAVPATVEAKRQTLLGFVYAPFRAADLLRSVAGHQRHPELAFEIHDGKELLFRTAEPLADTRFTFTETIEVAGRKWTVRFTSRRTGGGAPLLVTAGTAAGGVAISFLLFALIRVQMRARAEAEMTASRLRESEGELQQANRAKDEFLATLSHELRTPMTAIIGWAKLMSMSELDADTTAMAIDSIQQSSRTQAQLIDDLLDVSRITAGKMRIEKRPLDLRAVVSTAIDTVSQSAAAKEHRLEHEIPSGAVHVSGDAPRLQQIVLNLLTNAVKFTPRGGRIRTILRVDGKRAIIEVRDNGPGIEPDFLPHVFERFRQADSSTTRSYTGLGLGLAIVKHLATLHGGEVTAHSEGTGKGATFHVSLPLIEAPVPSVAEVADQTASGAYVRGAKLLIVDDEENVRRYVAAVFERSGANVQSAVGAADALGMIATSLPEVIITDLGMPEIDGYGFLERLRSNPATERIPVIALTAYARTEDRERAEQAGFQAFVTKPVEPITLLRVVAGVLRERILLK